MSNEKRGIYSPLFINALMYYYGVQKMINSRSLDQLDDDFKMSVLRWLNQCQMEGLDVLVVSTYRDNEYQNWLYSSGRTRKGLPIVTNAKGGQSMHNHRLALDFCIMDGKRGDWENIEAFTRAGMIAERYGLVWAGRWTGKIKELGHIEAQQNEKTLKAIKGKA